MPIFTRYRYIQKKRRSLVIKRAHTRPTIGLATEYVRLLFGHLQHL
jgi:hypothetical protein